MKQKLSAIWAILTARKDCHWFLMRTDKKHGATYWAEGWSYALGAGFAYLISKHETMQHLYALILNAVERRVQNGEFSPLDKEDER